MTGFSDEAPNPVHNHADGQDGERRLQHPEGRSQALDAARRGLAAFAHVPDVLRQPAGAAADHALCPHPGFADAVCQLLDLRRRRCRLRPEQVQLPGHVALGLGVLIKGQVAVAGGSLHAIQLG